jgi:hypothetical protein
MPFYFRTSEKNRPVKIIFKNTASHVDKTRRAFGHIREHYGNPFIFSDDFYLRLDFLIKQKGKIKYSLIDMLVNKYVKKIDSRIPHPSRYNVVYLKEKTMK